MAEPKSRRTTEGFVVWPGEAAVFVFVVVGEGAGDRNNTGDDKADDVDDDDDDDDDDDGDKEEEEEEDDDEARASSGPVMATSVDETRSETASSLSEFFLNVKGKNDGTS